MTALQKSINKWKRIEAKTGTDEGRENCALCNEHIDLNCSGCPVREASGFKYCDNTPLETWCLHHVNVHTKKGGALSRLEIVGKCRTCIKLAREEREFLEGLL